MSKKLLILFLAIISAVCLAFGITACSEDEGEDSGSSYYAGQTSSDDDSTGNSGTSGSSGGLSDDDDSTGGSGSSGSSGTQGSEDDDSSTEGGSTSGDSGSSGGSTSGGSGSSSEEGSTSGDSGSSGGSTSGGSGSSSEDGSTSGDSGSSGSQSSGGSSGTEGGGSADTPSSDPEVPGGETEDGDLQYIAEVAATCTTDGHIAYWYDADNDKYYSDAEGTTEIDQEDTILSATGHDYDFGNIEVVWNEDYTSAVATITCKNDSSHTVKANVAITSEIIQQATCLQEGKVTYTAIITYGGKNYYVSKTVTTNKTEHKLTYYKEVEATCTEEGNIEYWYCADCGKYYSDEECTTEISQAETIIAAGNHSYGSWAVTEPTSTSTGKATRECSKCGDVQTITLPVLNDVDYTYAVVSAATHTEDGTATYTYNGYTDIVITVTIPASSDAHVWDDGVVTIAATCTTTGVMTYTCTLCGEEKTETIPVTEHTADEAVIENYKAATCTENGSYDSVVYCSECGKELSREKITISATDHDYEFSSWKWTGYSYAFVYFICANDSSHTNTVRAEITSEVTTAATCTETGVITYTATVMVDGVTYTDTKTEVIAATGHNYESEVTAPTCTEQGYTTYTCSVCGDSYVDDYSDATGHTWDNGIVTTAATCTETGVKTYTCTVCGETKTETIAATGHTEAEAVIEKEVAATCTTAGSYDLVVYCSVCNEELSRETITVEATGHNYVSVITAPTCTEQGYTTHTCSVCNNSYTDNYTEALGHTWDDGVVTTAATCTETGVKTYTCTVCGETKTETIAATGHTEAEAIIENEVAATCTTAGSYDLVVYCSVCNAEISRETVIIAATGHTEAEAVIENEVAATCTTAGSYDLVVYCAVCHEELSRETITVEATGHSASTYTHDRWYHVYTCTACSEEITEEHIFEDGVCTICGYKADYSVGLAYTLSDDGSYYTVSGIGTCTDTEIIIPATYKYVAVTAIGSSVFSGRSSITSITIPSSITSIGTSAFYNCTALETINFNATEMEDLSSNNYVFYKAGTGGDGITVNIGAEVTKIPAYLFCPYTTTTSTYAPNILKIVFAENNVCTSIGNYAFYYCAALENIYYNATAVNDLTSSSKAFYGAGSSDVGITVTIGANVTKIPAYLFYSSSHIASVVFEDGSKCTSIGDNAFANCTSLTSITIPTGVTSVGSSAFYNCTGLTSVTIGSGVTSIGDAAFQNCSALTTINYNANLKNELSSNSKLFYSAGTSGTDITVTIGANVTSIPAYLFYSASKLTSIEFEGNSCTSIGDYAFNSCTSLTSITIPSSVTDIGDYAFYSCTSLTSVTIPDGVTGIGDHVFHSCTALTSINIPDSITYIGAYAFYGCTLLTSITIPEKVESIGTYAFNSCSALTTIIYNATSVTTVFDSSSKLFYSAGTSGTGITVTIGANVTSIPAYLFYSVSKITSVEFEGNSCTSIGTYAFYGCSSLASITMPVSVTSIGDRAFYNCSSLASVYYSGSASQWASISFSNTYDNPLYYAGNLYLPDTTSTTGYSLATEITIEDIETVNAYAFYNCTSLISVTIGSSITTIGSAAFSGCSGLVSVTLPFVGGNAYSTETEASASTLFGYIFGTSSYNGGTGIQQYYASGSYKTYYIPSTLTTVTITGGDILYGAFYDCNALTSVTIPNNVKSIGNCAFYHCTALTSVTISDSVETIGDYAFYYCSTVASLTIGSEVTAIGRYAFANCSSLTSISFGLNSKIATIGDDAFYYCTLLTSVYYGGTADGWSAITVGSNNTYLTNATIYYYSSSEPTDSGNYWYYDENGAITVWKQTEN